MGEGEGAEGAGIVQESNGDEHRMAGPPGYRAAVLPVNGTLIAHLTSTGSSEAWAHSSPCTTTRPFHGGAHNRLRMTPSFRGPQGPLFTLGAPSFFCVWDVCSNARSLCCVAASFVVDVPFRVVYSQAQSPSLRLGSGEPGC